MSWKGYPELVSSILHEGCCPWCGEKLRPDETLNKPLFHPGYNPDLVKVSCLLCQGEWYEDKFEEKGKML